MSAYQVGTDVIDLIVSAALEPDYHGERHRRGLTVYVPDTHVIYTDAMRACVTDTGYVRGGRSLLRVEVPSHVVTDAGETAGDIIGRELVAANVASVAARYPNDTRTDTVGGMVGYLPPFYKYRRVSRDRFADYAHVFGALACYEYQSCETGADTLAETITDRVRRDIAMRVFDASDDGDGSQSWHWSRTDADAARQAIRERVAAGLRH